MEEGRTPLRPDGSPLDSYRSCFRKARFRDEATATRKAKQYDQCIYLCEICEGFHLTKHLIGDYVAEINLKEFLRKYGFRHDGDHDRGAYWTNGAGRVSIRKSYTNHQPEVRAVMDQIRVLAKKKERIEQEAAKQLEDRARSVQKEQATVPVPTVQWPKAEEQKKVYSAAELINELTKAGKNPDEIARTLNAQAIRHPQVTGPWSGDDVREFRREPISRPQTPEEHAEAQAASVQEETGSGKGGARKKFKGAERLYVFGRMKAMLEAKMDTSAIAAALHAEGIRQPNNKEMDATYVSGIRNRWREDPKRMQKYASILMPRHKPGTPAPTAPRAVVVAPPPPPAPTAPRSRFNLPLSVDTLLHDKEVGDDERLQVLMIFVEVPESATSILGDPAISVTQKVAVIEAVGKRRKAPSEKSASV